MAEHRETFAEDVGGKLLLFATMMAVFGVIMLVLLPLGAALAPQPPAPPATVQTQSAPATPESPAPAPANESAAAAPAGPPPMVGAIMPGLFVLIGAAVLGAIAGLLLGHARARAEEARTTDPAVPQ